MNILGINIEPGDWPAEPPEGAPTDIALGYDVVEFGDFDGINSMAHWLGVDANSKWNPHHVCECVVKGIVLLPTVKACGSQELYDALKRHAGAHTHGYTHPPGEPRHWLDPEGNRV